MSSSNTYKSINPDFQETYADAKAERFKRLRKMLKGQKATAELEASKNPKAYMDKMQNPSIKGSKGIAF